MNALVKNGEQKMTKKMACSGRTEKKNPLQMQGINSI
jgi:hypothetical protein